MGGYIGNSVVGVEHPSKSALNATTGAFTGAVTADAGVAVDNITIDGTEIDLSSGDLTIDVAGDITLDADGADIILADGGTTFLEIDKDGNDSRIKNPISDGDIKFQGNDGGSIITALDLDMSAAGAATFNAGATFAGTVTTDNIANASSNLLIASTQSMTLRFDSDNDQTNREFNLQRNASTGILKAEETGDITFFSDDGSTQALRWDASTSRLGLGRTAPATTLDVAGTLTVTGTASRGLTITSAQTSTGQNDADAVYDAQDTEGGGGGSHIFKIGGTEHIALDSTGAIRVYTDTGGNGAGVFNTAQSAGTSANLLQARNGASNNTTSSGTQCFFMTTNGNIYNTNNTYGQISDEKLKQDIVDSTSQWDDIKAVQVKKFRFKDEVANFGSENVPLQIGVIAQELEAANMNGLVCEHTDRDDEGSDLGTTTKSVKYSVLYMKAVKALQEAMTRIETLEAKVAALENA
jgi:hypothetical protein